jgi:hypothetical protein
VRAAQRCLWSNASSDVRASVLVAAGRLDLPELDARLIAILAYVEPLRRGGEVYTKLKALSGRSISNASIGRLLGSAANIIGAFDLGVSFLTESNAELRKQAQIGNLPRVLFVQAWSEMEVGNWVGAAREAEEAVRLGEETGATLWAAAAMTVKANLAAMQGDLEQCEAHAVQVERLFLSTGVSFLPALLQLARGIAAIGAGRHLEALEHLQRLFAPADSAFSYGLQYFARIVSGAPLRYTPSPPKTADFSIRPVRFRPQAAITIPVKCNAIECALTAILPISDFHRAGERNSQLRRLRQFYSRSLRATWAAGLLRLSTSQASSFG